MKDTYTQALLELLKTTEDSSAVISGFSKTLSARGHERLFATVLKGVLRILESERPVTSVVAGSEAEAKKHSAAIKAALKEFDAPTEVSVATDDTLIGGFIVEHNHQRLDQSYKTKLVELYRSLTS